MKCKFVPGDRVVCVDAGEVRRGDWIHEAQKRLREGAVYTVEQVVAYRDEYSDDEDIVVCLVEVPRRYPSPPGFAYFRFRPAEDIEQFRRIVANAPRDLVPA